MDRDVLIIGGGIAGVSLAARLGSRARVTLLEAEATLAYHASGRSAALYEPRYGTPAVVELSLASQEFFTSAEGILSPRGLLMVGRDSDAEAFHADSAGMNLDPISVTEALAFVPTLNPDVVDLAAYAAHAWDIDTDRLIQGFARTARAAGAEILTAAPVTAIRRDGPAWVVDSGAGQFRAAVIVNAAGAWVDQIAAMAGIRPIGFSPCRRSMARIPAPDGINVSNWPMIFGAGESWYAKPDAGALIVSPAEEHLMQPHDAWADDMVLAEGLARYEAFVTTPVTRLLANWAGLRTFSPDRTMVIGFDAASPGFFWLAGQGGQGFQTCPAASALAADLIAGHPPSISQALIDALSPRRFGAA
jgi:glycine/D-amino acid oxidase-like deaminating enzyme